MKGQFFVLGAILLASLFFIGLPLTGFIVKPVTEDLSLFSANLKNEFPRALNLVLEENNIEKLGAFSAFVDNQITRRNAVFKNLWVVTEGNGNDVNVTVGNFLDEETTVVLNISNTIEILLMPAGTVDSTMFFSVPQEYTLTVTFPGLNRELILRRDKINLYSYFLLSRGEELIINEVVA